VKYGGHAKGNTLSTQAIENRTWWNADENKWKTTPAASASVAARNFLHDAATPSCGDARRAIAALLQLIHSFFSPRSTTYQLLCSLPSGDHGLLPFVCEADPPTVV
jgi:hypothetical protein